jgi:hypothetical protein
MTRIPKIVRERAMQHPAHTARGEDLGRHNDATDILKRERLFMRVPQVSTESLCWAHSDRPKECLTFRTVNQNNFHYPFTIVFRCR